MHLMKTGRVKTFLHYPFHFILPEMELLSCKSKLKKLQFYLKSLKNHTERRVKDGAAKQAVSYSIDTYIRYCETCDKGEK
jgi:hypothetical protein